jgi:uncharacterized membrane protein
MESKARLLGHSLHQIVIVFPLGLFMTSVGFDALTVLTGQTRWLATSYYIMIAGLIGGVVAVVAGYIDYLAIPAGTRAKFIGRVHGIGGVLVMLVFAANVMSRMHNPLTLSVLSIALSIVGATLAGIAGWFGGELVTRMGIGVADDAHVDAGRTSKHVAESSPLGTRPPGSPQARYEHPDKIVELL